MNAGYIAVPAFNLFKNSARISSALNFFFINKFVLL